MDDIKTLNSKKTHIFLNNVFSNAETISKDLELQDLSRELVQEIRKFKTEYDEIGDSFETQFENLGSSLGKFEKLRTNDKRVYPAGKIDFSFLENQII